MAKSVERVSRRIRRSHSEGALALIRVGLAAPIVILFAFRPARAFRAAESIDLNEPIT